METLKDPENWSKQLESSGADALLVNVWTCGLSVFQRLRLATKLPLVAHPALAGALGQGTLNDAIAPSVLLGTLMRAAGADLTLFPSPYGKIGLPLETAAAVADQCRASWQDCILPSIPVPSAGIKPEHVELAYRDFGSDFVLNAGTAIFASGVSVADSARKFLQKMEVLNSAK
jgi:2,3-diketo-5-methylthiopentyl-1-phosphate enolase